MQYNKQGRTDASEPSGSSTGVILDSSRKRFTESILRLLQQPCKVGICFPEGIYIRQNRSAQNAKYEQYEASMKRDRRS